ncbi:MAG TPA: alpha/beta fold hydrolase [Actinomycetota bacterium]|nr:alpha/beta fold hydrolase [Actinomycetota bacterium]
MPESEAPPVSDAPSPSPVAAPAPATVPPAVTSGAGTPVVLLHAFPLDGRMWAPQVEALAGSYQVIVPDLRGFGAAREQAVEEAGMELLADDVARLLDDRGLDRVVLGGLSMGGYVAFAFVRRHADRLGGLLLLDTKASADSEQARADRLRMAERVLAEGTGFVPETMLPRLLGKTSLEERPELVEQVTALVREQDPLAVAGAQRGMAARPDATDVLAAIAVPTLVVAGEEDAVIGPEVGRELAVAIPGARFLLVERAGHLASLERPEVVNEALLDFLAPIWV